MLIVSRVIVIKNKVGSADEDVAKAVPNKNVKSTRLPYNILFCFRAPKSKANCTF